MAEAIKTEDNSIYGLIGQLISGGIEVVKAKELSKYDNEYAEQYVTRDASNQQSRVYPSDPNIQSGVAVPAVFNSQTALYLGGGMLALAAVVYLVRNF